MDDAATFDPFGDRAARDIRNSLSTALVDELTGRSHMAVENAAAAWWAAVTSEKYRRYIRARQDDYRRAKRIINAGKILDPRRQAVVLWNLGLFFELHELLETIWHKSPEPEHTGLKGLIQAAGAYVHRNRGHRAAAARLAHRARRNLMSGMPALNFISNLDDLLAALSDLSIPPPTLNQAQ